MEYEYDDWKVCMDARKRFMREMPVWGLNGKVSRASFGVLVLGAAILTAFAGLGRSDLLVYVLPFAIAIGSLVANVASIALVPICVRITVRQIMGPRFPLAAVAWAVLTCALIGVGAWLLTNGASLWSFVIVIPACDYCGFVAVGSLFIGMWGVWVPLADRDLGIDWIAYAKERGWSKVQESSDAK